MFIDLFDMYFLSTYNKPGTVLGMGRPNLGKGKPGPRLYSNREDRNKSTTQTKKPTQA